jgi:hypothetical protein
MDDGMQGRGEIAGGGWTSLPSATISTMFQGK